MQRGTPITNDQGREIANWLYVVSFHIDISRHLQSSLFYYSEGFSPLEYVHKLADLNATDKAEHMRPLVDGRATPLEI